MYKFSKELAMEYPKTRIERFFENKNLLYATILLVGWTAWILTLFCVISPSVTIPSGERSCIEEAGSFPELLISTMTYPFEMYFSWTIFGWVDNDFIRFILSLIPSFFISLLCVNIVREILNAVWKNFAVKREDDID